MFSLRKTLFLFFFFFFFFFFFWWINTVNSILIRKWKPGKQPKAYKKYIIGAKRQKRVKQEENKNLTHPHLEPNQSKKSIKDKGQASIYNFVQDHKLHTKKYFNLCTENSSLSNAILFLFFHTAQKRHKGASFQAFFTRLAHKGPKPTKESLPYRIRENPSHPKENE